MRPIRCIVDMVLLAICNCCLVVAIAFADIRVATLAVYLSDTSPIGRLTISNTDDEAREIDITLRFAYPASDSFGNVSIRFLDIVRATDPSAVEWTTVYPKHFTLGPGEQQVVSIWAQPPTGLAEREYWARALILSRTMRSSGTDENARTMSPTHGIIYRTGIAINYRHGSVETQAVINTAAFTRMKDTLRCLFEAKRKGSAAFLGNVVIRLRDERGVVKKIIERQIAVYESLRRYYDISIEDIAPGRYTAEIELNTKRTGYAEGDIIQAPKVSKLFIVKL